MIRLYLIKLLKILIEKLHKHNTPPLVEYDPIIDKIVMEIDMYTSLMISPRSKVLIKEVLMDYDIKGK